MDDKYHSGAIIPETRSQAKEYLDRCGDGDSILSGCEALIDLRVESRRVLSEGAADQLFLDSGLAIIVRHCYNLPGGTEMMETLRGMLDGRDEYHETLSTAYNHLEQAAALLGVHPLLFLGLGKSKHEVWQHLRSFDNHKCAELPGVFGESRNEGFVRMALYNHANGSKTLVDDSFDEMVRKSDRRTGGGGRLANPSTNKLFVRMLWDTWPREMRENDGKWRPKVIASEILKYCGHEEITPNDFHRYADEVKAKEINAQRRRHEVPRKPPE